MRLPVLPFLLLLLPGTFSRVLSSTDFDSTTSHGSWLIEHFSPYCGHCRSFAPLWAELEADAENGLFGESVRLAQIDCTVSGDLCDAHKVRGYPTLNLYTNGKFVETFRGKRERKRIEEFIRDFAPPLGSGMPPTAITPEDLPSYLAENPVLYVLLHLGDTHLLNNLIPHISPNVSVPIVSISLPNPDPYKSLYARWKIPFKTAWALVVLKDGDINPSSVFTPHFPTLRGDHEKENLRTWIDANSLPTRVGVSAPHEVQRILDATHHPIVVLGRGVQEEVERIEKRRRSARGGEYSRDIVYVHPKTDDGWWDEWMYARFGVRVGDGRVVIVDHQNLRYYTSDVHNRPLHSSSPPLVLAGAIEGAIRGKLRGRSEEGYLKIIQDHPLQSLLFALVCFGIVGVFVRHRRRTATMTRRVGVESKV